MFPLGVAGGSQEMTKVVLLADSACKFITSLASKNNIEGENDVSVGK